MKMFGRLLLLFLLVAGIAQAQLTTATIVGNIQDTSGAVIPGAQVTAINQETQFTRQVTSGADGAYRLDFLPVGTYSLKVEAAGFQSKQQQGVVLTLNAEVHFDASLNIGEATQTVDVSSNELPLVETSNATLGRTVTNQEVDNLPIVNRNVYDLLTLTPGVQASSNVNTLGYPQQVVYMNGGTDNFVGSVSYYLDGGLNMTFIRNTGNVLPNPDALREFNVQTNNYNALYGRMSSGLVNVVTKSGTNKIHGSIFEFHRETNFAAAPAFSAPGPKAPLHRNQFGATLGGPIWKDKTFFFGSYAGLRQITSSTYNGALVPTAAQRAGDFSANLPASGTPTACPTNSSSVVFVVCDPVTRTPRPGNKLASSQLDPTVQRLLARIPLPNATGIDTASGRTTYRWQGIIPSTLNTDEFLIKVDHQIGTHRVQGMYFNTAGNQQQSPGGNIDWSRQNFVYRQQNGNLSDTWTPSANVVNQIWLNYTRMIGGRINTPQVSLADFGSSFGIQGASMLPQLTVSGYFTAAQAISGPVTGTNFYSLRDVVSITRGKHTFSFGAETSLNKDLQYTYLNNYGVFAFQRATARTNAEISDFIAGLPATMNQDSPVQAADNSWFSGIFAQDDYRIFRNLTLNLGLRWDVQTSPTDPKDRQSTFIAGQKSTIYPTAPTGLLVVGDKGVDRGIVATRWHHVSPRVGFAWDPFGNGRTAVRGAFGLFFGSVSGNEWNGVSNFQPFAVRNRYSFIKSMTDIYGDARSFPNGNPYPYVYDPKNPRPFISPAQVQGIDLDYQWPYVYQTNFSVQQQVTNSIAVSVSYVGSFSHDVPFAPDINYPIYATATSPVNGVTTSTTSNYDSRRPIQGGLGIINLIQSKQRANYHGLQITGEKRLSHQFSVKAFYTWSKTLSSASVNNSGAVIGTAQDFNRMQDEYGSSDTDLRHQANISAIWKPAFFTSSPRYVREVVNGWTISGIAQLNAGTPFSVTTGVDNNFDGYTSDRANLSGNADVGIIRGRSRADKINSYFNPAAFCSYTGSTATCPAGVGPGGLDGTTRRNNYFGPGNRVINAAIFRDFGVYEAVKFQLRAEVNNVFNLVNLGNPTTSLNSGNFGKITGAYGVPRQIQIGGRILF